MAICNLCNKNFSRRAVIDGKQRLMTKRKYCLECSPFGKRNTQKLETLPNLPEGCCKNCGKTFEYKRSKGHRKNFCSTCEQAKRREKMKQACVDYKGGACKVCGYNRCISALSFHHLNPSEKDFNISANNGCKSWDKMKKELDKCVLLCSNCHSEVHYGLIDNKLLENS